MSERQAPWWANQPAPEMTRSERARWTDLQVLAFLLAFDTEDTMRGQGDEPLTSSDVAAALWITRGRAVHSLRMLEDRSMVGRDGEGWYIRAMGSSALLRDGFSIGLGSSITYPYTKAAA